jgi:hypothetical protein
MRISVGNPPSRIPTGCVAFISDSAELVREAMCRAFLNGITPERQLGTIFLAQASGVKASGRAAGKTVSRLAKVAARVSASTVPRNSFSVRSPVHQASGTDLTKLFALQFYDCVSERIHQVIMVLKTALPPKRANSFWSVL